MPVESVGQAFRLQEVEHDCGLTVFQHAAGGYRFKTAGIALPVWQIARLAQIQKSGSTGGEAGGGGFGSVDRSMTPVLV
jgi:hypothetical protein